MRVLIPLIFLSISCFAGLLGAEVTRVGIPHSGIQAQVQIDSSGKLHMIYFLGEASAGDLHYVTRGKGDISWSEPIRVNHAPKAAVATGTIRGAHMSLGKGNRIHVSWFGSSLVAPKPPEGQYPQAPLMVTRMNDDHSGFEPERNVMTWTTNLDGGGSIAADQEGNVYVAWHGRGDSPLEGEMGRTIFMAISRDHGKTFGKEIAIKEAPSGSCACCGMRVFMHPVGQLHIVYRGIQGKVRPMIDLWSDDRGVSFKKQLFNPWEIEACPMSSVTLLSLENEILIATEQEGNIQLNGKPLDQSSLGIVSKKHEPWKGKHPSLARDRSGNVLLAWAEGAGWAKGGKLRWVIMNKEGAEIASNPRKELPEIPAWSFPTACFFEDRFQVIF